MLRGPLIRGRKEGLRQEMGKKITAHPGREGGGRVQNTAKASTNAVEAAIRDPGAIHLHPAERTA